MTHTPIPPEELDVFSKLDDIQVVIDVGARADTAYFGIHPKAEYHLFEPNPDFFAQLKEAVGKRRKTYLNAYGLSDEEGDMPYSDGLQAFLDGEAPATEANRILPLQTLDWYVKGKKIKRVDFLKVDVEGYDYKVLLGAEKSLKISRFVQYEYWDDPQEFEGLLGKDFDMEYIGYRNVLCMNKKLVSSKKRKALRDYIQKMGYKRLA